jgi:hypothetical protein
MRNLRLSLDQQLTGDERVPERVTEASLAEAVLAVNRLRQDWEPPPRRGPYLTLVDPECHSPRLRPNIERLIVEQRCDLVLNEDSGALFLDHLVVLGGL